MVKLRLDNCLCMCYIDGKIVYGGEATVFYKDKYIECCGSEECMRKAEKIIEEAK